MTSWPRNLMDNYPRIEVLNRQRKVAVNLSRLADFAERALEQCRRARPNTLDSLGEISVALVSDRRMAQLHKRFMQIAGPTDVITFQHGEIVISTETARRQARVVGTTTNDEIRLYLVHGLLHLSGMDDQQPAEARAMRTAQKRILRALSM